MRIEPVDLLFFGAHPDDVELSCGGTVARLAQEGRRIGIVDLTRGEMGTRGTPETRREEAAAAARVLGAVFRQQLDFGDGGLQTGREQELQLIDVIRHARPRLVFAPWPDDRHPDHTRAGQLITAAAFYSGLKRLERDEKAHRPQATIYYQQNYIQPPSFIFDVSRAWKAKLDAMASFKSQFFDPKSNEPQTFISRPEFMAMIDARGRHFGAMIGVDFGEAFVTKQPPRIDDIIGAYRGREV